MRKKKKPKRKDDEEDLPPPTPSTPAPTVPPTDATLPTQPPAMTEDQKELERLILTELRKWDTMTNEILSKAGQLTFVHGLYDKKVENLLVKNEPTRFDLEEQGFFVSIIPDIAPKNTIRLMNRLKWTEPDRPWFVTENQLDLLPDPFIYNHPKPVTKFKAQDLNGAESGLIDLEADEKENLDLVWSKAKPFPKGGYAWRQRDYQLNVDLVGITFKDHPLMLPEQRLAIQIKQWVDTMHQRQRTNLVTYLDTKLETLKKSYEEAKAFNEELKRKIEADTPTTPGYKTAMFHAKADVALLENENTRLRLLKEIRSTRLLRDMEMQTDRLLEYKIVKGWNELKQARSQSGFISTRAKLTIRAKKAKKQAYDPKVELEHELEERKAMHEIEVIREKRRYEKVHKEWVQRQDSYRLMEEERAKALDTKELDALAPQPVLALSETGKTESNQAMIAPSTIATSDASSMHPRQKSINFAVPFIAPYDPEPLPSITTEFYPKKHKMEIKKRLQSSFRPTDAPILQFVWEETTPVTETYACPPEEQSRRRQLESSRYVLQLYYNDKKVTATVPKPLDPSTFTIDYRGLQDLSILDANLTLGPPTLSRTAFQVKVNELPSNISVQLFEESVYGLIEITEVFLPIPAHNETNMAIDRQVNQFEFSGKSFERPVLQNIKQDSSEGISNGVLKLNISWAVDDNGQSLGPPAGAAKPSQLGYYKGEPLNFKTSSGILNVSKMMVGLFDVGMDPRIHG